MFYGVIFKRRDAETRRRGDAENAEEMFLEELCDSAFLPLQATSVPLQPTNIWNSHDPRSMCRRGRGRDRSPKQRIGER